MAQQQSNSQAPAQNPALPTQTPFHTTPGSYTYVKPGGGIGGYTVGLGSGGGGSAPDVPKLPSASPETIAQVQEVAKQAGIADLIKTSSASSSINTTDIQALASQGVSGQIVPGKNFSSSEQQAVNEYNRVLPFEYLTNKITQVAGEVSKRVLDATGLSGIKVTGATGQIAQRRTISTDMNNPAFPSFSGGTSTLGQSFPEAVKTATAIGQYAIPYVGQALFLGALAEKPLLRPQEFKAQFQAEPVKTAILYSAGLVGVAGGIRSALSSLEIKQLNAEIRNAQINFIAHGDEDTLRILAETRIRGQPIISLSQVRTLEREGKSTLYAGKEAQTKFNLDKNKIELSIRNVLGKSSDIGGKASRITPESSSKLIRISKVEGIEGNPFISRGASFEKFNAVFDSRRGFNIKNGQVVFLGKEISAAKVPYKLIKNQVVGVVSPTEAENLFKVIAGDPKLRIYKNGGVSYVFNPKINGWLMIKPGSFLSGEGKVIVLRKLEGALANVGQGLKARAFERFAPQVRRLQSTAKLSESVGIIAKRTGKTIEGFPTLSSRVSLTTEKAPRIVTGLSGSKSVYSGKGTYERTEQTTYNIPKAFSGTSSGLNYGIKSGSSLKSVSLIRGDEIQRQVPSLLNRARELTKSESGLKSVSLLKSEQIQNQIQRQQSRQQQKQRTENRTNQKYRIPTPFKNSKKLLTPSRKRNGLQQYSKIRSSRLAVKTKFFRNLAIRAERPARSPLNPVVGREFNPRRLKLLGSYLGKRYQTKLKYASELQRKGKINKFRVIPLRRRLRIR